MDLKRDYTLQMWREYNRSALMGEDLLAGANEKKWLPAVKAYSAFK